MTSKAVLIPAVPAAGLVGSASYAGDLKPALHLAESEAKVVLKAMDGKRVLGKLGERLGHIGKVDEGVKAAELKGPVSGHRQPTDGCGDDIASRPPSSLWTLRPV